MRVRESSILLAVTTALSLSACTFGRTDLLEAQIEVLHAEVADLAESATECHGRMETVHTHLENAGEQLDSLTDAFEDVDSSIDDLEAKYRRINLINIRSAMDGVEDARQNLETEIQYAKDEAGL